MLAKVDDCFIKVHDVHSIVKAPDVDCSYKLSLELRIDVVCPWLEEVDLLIAQLFFLLEELA